MKPYLVTTDTRRFIVTGTCRGAVAQRMRFEGHKVASIVPLFRVQP